MNKRDVKFIFDGEVSKVFFDMNIDLLAEGWKLAFNRRKRALGLCNYTKKTIELSVYFIKNATYAQVVETVKHELAHALTPGDGHGRAWKAVYMGMGGNGQRLAKQEDGYKPMKVKPKWVLVDKRNDEVVYEYHAKPRRPAHRLMVQDDPTTLGNLEYRKVSFR